MASKKKFAAASAAAAATTTTTTINMRFCNGVDENFQHDFVINIGYCITEACITNSITLQKSW